LPSLDDLVQGTALVVGEVIAFVVNHQVGDRPLGQGCRIVENEAPLLDTRSETADVPYCTGFRVPGNLVVDRLGVRRQAVRFEYWRMASASITAP
jgi:hypothetical protein